jgi:hypothetical protein
MTKREKALLAKFDLEYDRLNNRNYPPHLGRTLWAAFYKRRREVAHLIYRRVKENRERRFSSGTVRQIKALESSWDGDAHDV